MIINTSKTASDLGLDHYIAVTLAIILRCLGLDNYIAQTASDLGLEHYIAVTLAITLKMPRVVMLNT